MTWSLPLLILLFVGSGCSALIYEIVWFQLLELVIGSSAVSMAVLLGTFMGGMCLGSLFSPRIISRRRHPIRIYALLELGIAIIGLLLLFGMPFAGRLLFRAVIAGLCMQPIPPEQLWARWRRAFYSSNGLERSTHSRR